MRILITGATGLVGSACVEFFAAKGWDVLGIDNDTRSWLFGTEKRPLPAEHMVGNAVVKYFNIDIADQGNINWLMADYPVDAVIHAAAQPSHDWAKNDPLKDFEINAKGTLVMLEATRKYSPQAVFVHVSTDKVYGENMSRQLTEMETRFDSPYPFNERLGLDFAGKRSLFGCSKTAADVYAQEYASYFGMKVGIFRPGCITGKKHAGAEYHGFLAYLANCIKNGKTYKIFGHKGKQVRDQIHALDLASAFYVYITNPVSGAVYNIGGGRDRSVSVLEAGKLLSDAIGKPFLYEFHEARAGDRVWDVHDITKFRTDYPQWDFQYSLQDIIKDLA